MHKSYCFQNPSLYHKGLRFGHIWWDELHHGKQRQRFMSQMQIYQLIRYKSKSVYQFTRLELVLVLK
jgi:hypothetical protein